MHSFIWTSSSLITIIDPSSLFFSLIGNYIRKKPLNDDRTQVDVSTDINPSYGLVARKQSTITNAVGPTCESVSLCENPCYNTCNYSEHVVNWMIWIGND